MTVKNDARIRWGVCLWLVFWILGFFQMGTPLWKALWAGIAIVYVGSYYLVSRHSMGTERRLQRASGALLGLMCVQILVVIFLAFEAAAKK
jgi:hypothetical protein